MYTNNLTCWKPCFGSCTLVVCMFSFPVISVFIISDFHRYQDLWSIFVIDTNKFDKLDITCFPSLLVLLLPHLARDGTLQGETAAKNWYSSPFFSFQTLQEFRKRNRDIERYSREWCSARNIGDRIEELLSICSRASLKYRKDFSWINKKNVLEWFAICRFFSAAQILISLKPFFLKIEMKSGIQSSQNVASYSCCILNALGFPDWLCKYDGKGGG